MTLNFEVKITINAGQKTKAIFDSINTDNEFYPENPTKTKISMGPPISISVESEHLPQLRANLNSILRLIHTSYDSIESVKI